MSHEILIRAARLEDLMGIEAQEAQRIADPRQLLGGALDLDTLGSYLGAYAWTLDCEGSPIVCAGIVLQWPGVASCWGLFAESALAHPSALSRFARKGLEAAGERFTLRRIETSAPCTHARAHRWLEHLGFESEGISRGYGIDGSDHVRYARVH